MAFGILTTDSVEQAVERAGPGPSNKGHEAAMAAVEMAALRQALEGALVSRGPPGAARWDERHRAREAALRVLYQVDVGGVPIADALDLIEQRRRSGGRARSMRLDARSRPVSPPAPGSPARLSTRSIAPHLRTGGSSASPCIDRFILWLAVHEWLSEPATPPRVVLSEALELARAYSGDAAVRFVNGVLDAVYRQLKQEGRIID